MSTGASVEGVVTEYDRVARLKKNQKVFKISYHIESCDTYIKY